MMNIQLHITPPLRNEWIYNSVLLHALTVAYECRCRQVKSSDPVNTELNPICHLLALLEAHHIFHVNRIRVNTDKEFSLWKKAGTPDLHH